MNYSYKCEHEMFEDKPEEKTPEYHLWLAVVDRAIYDYATLLTGYANGKHTRQKTVR
jgi:hypothetical protein